MARRNLSAHQQRIVKRYYENLDTIQLTRLSELVSDLFMAQAGGEQKKLDSLWKRTETQLKRLRTEPPIPESRLDSIVERRDLEDLGRLVGELGGR